MKKLIVATTITSFAAGAAVAGNLAEPEMESEVMVEEVVEEPAGSSGAILPVLLGLTLIGLAASS